MNDSASRADRPTPVHTIHKGDPKSMALIARSGGGFALVADTLAQAEARARARARHLFAVAHSQRLCEDLAEHLGWLHRPDDADRIDEVVAAIREGAAALDLCVGSLPRQPAPVPTAPLDELAAIVEAVDAEVRLALLGDLRAHQRARTLAATLRSGVATLIQEGAA